jgi:hypothetical protein
LYDQLKAIHNTINTLKSKSGLGFVWDDAVGMGMKEDDDRKPQWDELVRVRERMSTLLMISNYYQSNNAFGQFANRGWPHCAIMDQLSPSKAKGTHAHRGTQPPASIAAPSSSSATPFDSVPGSSSMVSKRKQLSFDAPVESSHSSKRRKNQTQGPEYIDKIGNCIGAIETAIDKLSHSQAETQPVRRPRRSHSLPPAQKPSQTVRSATAKILQAVESYGDEWLPQDILLKIMQVFADEEKTAGIFLTIFRNKKEPKDLIRAWVDQQLSVRNL